MKKLITTIFTSLACLCAQAASPSFGAFNKTQFNTDGSSYINSSITPSNSAVVPIPNGGTGQTNASAGLSALGAGGGSTIATPILTSPQIQEPNAQQSTGPSVVFPVATSGDQPFMIVGSALSSGAGPAMPMLTTDTHFPIAASGAHSFDDLALAVLSVPWQAPAGDGAGWTGIVDNSPEPIVFMHAHSGGNTPNIYMTGDVTNGDVVEIPFYDGTNSDNQVLPLRYDVTGTNYFFAPTNMPKLFEVKQDTGAVNIYNPQNKGTFGLLNGASMTTAAGTLITLGGQLSNAVAFNSLDPTTVQHNSAQILATNYGVFSQSSATPHGYMNSTAHEGWLPTDNNFGMILYDNQAVQFCMGAAANTFADGGIFPTGGNGNSLGNDNTLDLGAIQHTWKQVATHAIVAPISTNSMCGNFFLNGTTPVNVGNTSITSTNITFSFSFYGANGGTQAGIVLITGITPGTGFSVKGIALDLSYVRYTIITNF